MLLVFQSHFEGFFVELCIWLGLYKGFGLNKLFLFYIDLIGSASFIARLGLGSFLYELLRA